MPRAMRGRGSSTAGRRLLPAFGFLVALLPLAAVAQSSDVRSLSDQVERLQRELSDLQRQVYRGGPVPAGAANAVGDGSVDASQEVRLQQLETELRDLTGKVEEALFGVRQVREQLDKLSEDIDFRLRALEQKSGASAPMAQNAGPDASRTSQTAPDGSAAGGTGTAVAGMAPQTLGTLSEKQMEAFEAAKNKLPPASEPPAAVLSPEPQGRTPEEQYDYAFGLLRRANYAEAESALKGFVERYSDHPLAGNAQYWLGETYYVRGDYTRAAVAFAEGYQKYPKGGKAPDNLLKLGMSLAEIGRKDDACRAFQELEQRFPNAAANLKERAARERQRRGCS